MSDSPPPTKELAMYPDEKGSRRTRGSFTPRTPSPAPFTPQPPSVATAFLIFIFFALFTFLPSLEDPANEVNISHVLNHLRILDRLVNYHGGNRHANGTGYTASAMYIENVIGKDKTSCDKLERQWFQAPLWKQTKPSASSVIIGVPRYGYTRRVHLQEGQDYSLLHGPSATLVNATMVELEDFGCNFVARARLNLPVWEVYNKVIFLKRPSLDFIAGRSERECTLNDVVTLGGHHGALAVVIANGAEDDALWPFAGWLDVPWIQVGPSKLPRIPVLAMSFATAQLVRQGAFYDLTTDASVTTFDTFNLLCTWEPASEEAETVVIGAHLDSVADGPGIVDNGSGAATVLEWMRALKKAGWKDGKMPQERRIVWAWWGAEELGLIGSQYFAHYSARPLNVVAALNVDMIASPNGVPRVVDSSSAPSDALIPPSAKIQKRLETEFRALREPWERMNTSMLTSDEWSFLEVGVPAGGLMNGASKRKTQSQREIYGGMANAQFDPCYHQRCDTFQNVNVGLLKLLSKVGFNTAKYLILKKDLNDWLWDGKED